jgi:DNA (cytosine-5)-methyltransferase 1
VNAIEQKAHPLSALDFFAGSGLVRLGLAPFFETVWANDCCPRKAAVYRANFSPSHFHLGDVSQVAGAALPDAKVAWASFPCQDLSLAGAMSGIEHGTRSGLFWQWIRILQELRAAGRQPLVLCAENVVGFLSSSRGEHFKFACRALRRLGYRVGAVVVDASLFLPQSRPRTFLVGVSEGVPLTGLTNAGPALPFHTPPVVRAATAVDDPGWIWWSLPTPRAVRPSLWDVYDDTAPCDSPERTATLLRLLSTKDRQKLREARNARSLLLGTGYRRTRRDAAGMKRQRLELRFDGCAGCLRTPAGGSSRQLLFIVRGGSVRSRLLTVRECARLMGVVDSFQLPGSYNDGYRAMGDAVAVPVTRFLAEHLLHPLACRSLSVKSGAALY